MKSIGNLFDIKDGGRYFIMTNTYGRINTGIVKADVQTYGKPIASSIKVNFVMDEKNSDLSPGVIENIIYMAEIDE